MSTFEVRAPPRIASNYDGACFSDVFRFFESELVAGHASSTCDGACFLGILRFKTDSRGAAFEH